MGNLVGTKRESGDGKPGRALQWWLKQLDNATTRRALLERQQHT